LTPPRCWRASTRSAPSAGIHVALTAIAALRDAYSPPPKALEVGVLCDEEGSRFRANFWGSRALTGQVAPAEADGLRDADGATMCASPARRTTRAPRRWTGDALAGAAAIVEGVTRAAAQMGRPRCCPAIPKGIGTFWQAVDRCRRPRGAPAPRLAL
jgi:hypothetical protein